MKPEIFLLLDKGFKPKQVAEMLDVKIGLVYYYNKHYKVAKEKVNQLIVDRTKESI